MSFKQHITQTNMTALKSIAIIDALIKLSNTDIKNTLNNLARFS